MEVIPISRMKKLIAMLNKDHKEFVEKAKLARRYYISDNDIFTRPLHADDPNNPKNANNRITSKIYPTIVDQKADYGFRNAIIFDLNRRYPGDVEGGTDTPYGGSSTNMTVEQRQKLSNQVHRVLGSMWARTCRKLSVDASNCGRSILHYWVEGDEYGIVNEKKGKFRYGVVDPLEVQPLWGNKLKRDLLGVLRHYKEITKLGECNDIYEWWNDEFCYAYIKDSKDELKPYDKFFYFSTDTNEYRATNIYKHGFNRVPFIIFRNNAEETTDLNGLKERIDAYDFAYTEFANNIEDFQDMIMVLSGYGGEIADDFLNRLKNKKLIKLEGGFDGKDWREPKLETLAVEIPVEATKMALDEGRKALYEQGGGVDQTPEMLSYTTSEALKYRYAMLELQMGKMQDEFEVGFNILVKAICEYLGHPIDEEIIDQRWTRNKINNDTELINNARLCLNFTSLRTALKVNPYVDDVEEEMERIEIERQEQLKQEMEYAEKLSQVEFGTQRQESFQYSQNSSEKKINEPEKYAYNKKRQEQRNNINKAGKGQ